MTEELNISVEQVCKRFDGFALDRVSFQVPKGRIVGFIGENGAGKSTTIRLILNELKKDSGRIEIFGKEHTDPSIRQDLGVVFDECRFHDVLSTADMEKILAPSYPNWDRELYRHYLERFALPLRKPIGSLSKGMRAKLSILCALAHHPRLLILDEATTGLDPVVREEILDLFLEFIQDETHSILFSSHITSDIEKIADYVVLLHQGRVILEEQKDDLIYHYGILKCSKHAFSAISPEDYLTYRETAFCMECLVPDREAARQAYPGLTIDHGTLEDIMMFYIKEGTSCED